MDKPKLIDEILADPAASFWLKDAIKTLLQRDCLDAATDAEMLHRIFNTYCGAWHRLPDPPQDTKNQETTNDDELRKNAR